MVRKVPLALQIGYSLQWEYVVFLSPVPGNTLDIDIVQGQAL